MPGQKPTEAEVLSYFQKLSNWGKWGKDDQLGTINYVTPQKVKEAAALVKEGASVSCSRPIGRERAVDVMQPVLHYMDHSGEQWVGKKSKPGEIQGSADFIGLSFHGLTITHIDSLCHVFWDGQMYNGHPAEKVTTREGATMESIDLLRDGVVTRGVLLDIARLRGIDWLEPGDAIFPAELEEAERACGVRVRSGDVLFFRTGMLRRRNQKGAIDQLTAGRPGLQAACLPWLHERQIAMLGSDVPNDVSPSGYPQLKIPVHQVGLVAMGLWLIDNLNLEELTVACQRYQRWEFMAMVSPLRIANGTGSPVNPIAVF